MVILVIPLILASQALPTDIPWPANAIFRLVEGHRKKIQSQLDLRSRPSRRIARLPMRELAAFARQV
jgi:hypothetical protein